MGKKVLGKVSMKVQKRVANQAGLKLYANAFLAAAEAVPLQTGENLPVYLYLLCHSIELAFKTHLVKEGWSEDQITKLGHDLEKCQKEAGRLAATMTPKEEKELGKANILYKKKQLEYFPFWKRVQKHNDQIPDAETLKELATKLVKKCLS